jgi:hypothetical protein
MSEYGSENLHNKEGEDSNGTVLLLVYLTTLYQPVEELAHSNSLPEV